MSGEIEVERSEQVGNLTIAVTYNRDSRTRAVQVTRRKKGGRVSAMTFFPDEIDDLIEAMNDAADVVQGVANEQRLPTPPIARAAPRKLASAGADRGR